MIDIKSAQRDIEYFIDKSLNSFTPKHSFQEVYRYSLLPAGKLFRPLLVRSIALDLDKHNKDHEFLEAFVEVHHVYTLIHDDLPCMDDDNERRGRASSHIKFNEWKALLAGDGLLNLSFHLVSQINSSQPFIARYLSWCTGPKGLIQGQVLDLGLEMTNDFSTLLKTHELKTSRLIQVALTGSAIVSEAPFSFCKDMHRLGLHLGIAFQLLDDLCELVDTELSTHEASVNPFLKFPDHVAGELSKRLDTIENLLEKHKLKSTKTVLGAYFSKTNSIVENDLNPITKHYAKDKLEPIISTLHRLCLADNTL